MKKFTIIYEELDHLKLGKPQGMYPTYMKYLGWNSEVVTYDKKNELPKEFRGVKVKIISQFLGFLPNDNFFKFIKRLNLYRYIYKNAKSIDVMMLYHLTKCSYWNTLFYKLGNPNGKVFIKGDFDFPEFQDEVAWLTKKPKSVREFFKKRRWSKEFRKRLKLVKMMDIFSVETEESFEGLLKYGYAGLDVSKKLLHLPNGFDLKFIEEKKIRRKRFHEKEKIIFTASRLGTKEKNTEFLLEVLSKVNLKEWKVVLAGPIEKEFQIKIASFFEKNPGLREKIKFLGNIKDKTILYDYYNRSKIFIMTSRGEGFANVFLEALYFGNYIITTNVSSALDVTKNNTVGSIVQQNDLDNYVRTLQNALDDNEFLEEKYHETIKLSGHFLWEETALKLNERITGISEG